MNQVYSAFTKPQIDDILSQKKYLDLNGEVCKM